MLAAKGPAIIVEKSMTRIPLSGGATTCGISGSLFIKGDVGIYDDDGGVFANPCSDAVEFNVFVGFVACHSVTEHKYFYHLGFSVDGKHWFVYALAESNKRIFKSVHEKNCLVHAGE